MERAITAEERDAIRVGLQQIDTKGLRRLMRWIKEGKPLALDGSTIDNNGCG